MEQIPELFIMSKQYYVLVTWHMEFLNPWINSSEAKLVESELSLTSPYFEKCHLKKPTRHFKSHLTQVFYITQVPSWIILWGYDVSENSGS